MLSSKLSLRQNACQRASGLLENAVFLLVKDRNRVFPSPQKVENQQPENGSKQSVLRSLHISAASDSSKPSRF